MSSRVRVVPERALRTAWRRGARLYGALCAVWLAVVVSCLAPAGALAAGRPPGGSIDSSVIRAIDIATPAVVRIATITSGHISFELCGASVPLPEPKSGFKLGGLGSGAFISAHGDILTADHVVDIPREELDAEWFAGQSTSAAIARLLNAYASCLGLSQPLTAGDIQAGFVQFAGIVFHTQYDPLQRLIWRNTAFTGAITSGGSSADSYTTALLPIDHQEAQIVQASAPEDNDIALLHVNQTDTPSIEAADATSLAVQDKLTVIGFPGNADLVSHFDKIGGPNSLLTPSVNTLTISALKPNFNGATLILVAGNVEHGDSGGPALDASGHLVGVASFVGDTDPVGTSYFRSGTEVQALIASAKVDTHPGRFQTLWRDAFTDYAATYPGHWHTAARELDALAATYPAFQGVRPYKDYADQAAANEVIPPETPPAAVVGVLAVMLAALVGLIVLGVVVVLRRRGRRSRSTTASLSPGWISGYGYPYPSTPYGPPQPPYPYGLSADGPSSSAVGAPIAASIPASTMVGSPSTQESSPDTIRAYDRGSAPLSPASLRSSPSSPAPPSAVQQAATPNGYDGWSSSTPVSRSFWGTQSENHAGNTTNGMNGAAFCMNGHVIASGEARCGICGAARAESLPFKPR